MACTPTQTQYKYVCFNGATVDKISDCPVSPNTETEQQYAITPQYLTEELKKDSAIVLLDLREKDEFDKSHLEGAKHIPLGAIWKAHLFKRIPREDPIVLYDNDEIRASVAFRELRKIGYKNIVKLAGGIHAWQEAGYLVIEDGQLQKGTPII